MSELQIPLALREAIRKTLAGKEAGSVVAVSEIQAAVHEVFASADLDPELLEDAIASEATLANLAVEFDQNAHKR